MPSSGRDKVVRHVVNCKRTLQVEEQVIGNQNFKQQRMKQKLDFIRNLTIKNTYHEKSELGNAENTVSIISGKSLVSRICK